ncbi:MAG: signal peptidase I [Bacteroidia bacterium]|nr:signal peptidase I [Bacteroidia bacterium]MBP7261941.1 signal peptidase I [Bacteroidia bacterium]MBP9725815.1 signal peptidase I [Bacteroidia bacterium]
MNFFKNFFAILTKREKTGFWFLTALNVLLFLLLIAFTPVSFVTPVTLVVLTQVILFAYYYFINKLERKSKTREWIDAIAFAVVAATLIRGLFLEAYTIPTPSMEKSLLVGDFLFVSKYHYGPRVPMTPISFPFAHHTMPVLGTKAYSEAIKLPYYRLPGFTTIKNNDVVVFNYPAENEGRPVDKKENYIKRCIAIPGDSISLVDGQVFVNGKANENAPRMQMIYHVKTKDGNGFDPKYLKEIDANMLQSLSNQGDFQMQIKEETVPVFKGMENVQTIEPIVQTRGEFMDFIYPFRKEIPWNVDNYGPLYIPKAGDNIPLTQMNYWLYEKAIRDYEGNPTLKMENGKVYINDKEITSYTFQRNYYFMMGDNRHFSADSRFWGMVPDDHIVGKAVFIWMSWDANESNVFKKVRWNRLFNLIH